MPISPSEMLLTYKVIDLDAVSGSLTSEFARKQVLHNIVEHCSNEPLEIRGQAPLVFVYELFEELKEIATEIIYRPHQNEDAYILFSTLGEEDGIHPSQVKSHLVEWSEEEIQTILSEYKKDRTITEIFEGQEWLKTGLKEFLLHLYQVNPEKKSVEVRGNLPVLLFVHILSWFYPFHPEYIFS